MKGATEYCRVFKKPEQFGRLFVLPGRHARGETFRIFILPDGESSNSIGPNAPTNKNTIEVYGVISGNPGWTESYGWLHSGKWRDDMAKLFTQRRDEMTLKERQIKNKITQNENAENNRIKHILESYE